MTNISPQQSLSIMLGLTVCFFLIEIIVGYITNSMAMVADSFHMFSDAIALVIAFVSVRMSPKEWSKNTFGWARAEVLGALVNAVFLCALCISILIESVKRFIKPEVIHEPVLLLIVGSIGLSINLIGLCMFKENHHHHHHHHHHHSHHHQHSHDHDHKHQHNQHHHDEQKVHHKHHQQSDIQNHNGDTLDNSKSSSSQMNLRGVFLHVLADALGSVVVMISALAVMFTSGKFSWRQYVDPSLSVIMVCVILFSTWPLLLESGMILLQTVPTHIHVELLQKRLTEQVKGVLAVHEFHVWQLAGDKIIASAHIRCHNLEDYMRIAEEVKEFFHNEGIHSTTIQPEFPNLETDHNQVSFDNCALDCPVSPGPSCAPQTCCGSKKSASNVDNSPLGGDPAIIITSTPSRHMTKNNQDAIDLDPESSELSHLNADCSV